MRMKHNSYIIMASNILNCWWGGGNMLKLLYCNLIVTIVQQNTDIIAY